MTLSSLDDTRALARLILGRCPAGSLLLLSGPLGAGKTTLVQQLALALDAKAAVSSPTYTLIHEYPTPQGLLVHCDAYRLPSAAALIDLGLDDYLARSRLVAVEWGERLLIHYPQAYLVKLSLVGEARHAELWQGGRRLVNGAPGDG